MRLPGIRTHLTSFLRMAICGSLLIAGQPTLYGGDLSTPRHWIRVKDHVAIETAKNVHFFQRFLAYKPKGCVPLSEYNNFIWRMSYDLYCVVVEDTDVHALEPFLRGLPLGMGPVGPLTSTCVGPHTAMASAGMMNLLDLLALESQGSVKVTSLHFLYSTSELVVGGLAPGCGSIPSFVGEEPIVPDPGPLRTAWPGRTPRMKATALLGERIIQAGAQQIPVLVHRWVEVGSIDPDGDPAITFWDPRAPDLGNAKPTVGLDAPWDYSSLKLGGAIRLLAVEEKFAASLREYLAGSK